MYREAKDCIDPVMLYKKGDIHCSLYIHNIADASKNSAIDSARRCYGLTTRDPYPEHHAQNVKLFAGIAMTGR